ncbi:MAG: hypothetical protein SH850_15755 [Planctomycetaceae bacterium]|nr:hypothetical protein [Planctomycetaceae bacterium]
MSQTASHFSGQGAPFVGFSAITVVICGAAIHNDGRSGVALKDGNESDSRTRNSLLEWWDGEPVGWHSESKRKLDSEFIDGLGRRVEIDLMLPEPHFAAVKNTQTNLIDLVSSSDELMVYLDEKMDCLDTLVVFGGKWFVEEERFLPVLTDWCQLNGKKLIGVSSKGLNFSGPNLDAWLVTE